VPLREKDLADRHRVSDGKGFRLADVDPADTLGVDVDRDEAVALLAADTKRQRKLQERLYAEGRWAVLMVFQAMDSGGKDSAIEHVMTGINPQGCDVRAFKAPGPIELRHDFLWRHQVVLPERGRIGIFNRSHYEEVLVAKVHPEILAAQNLPASLVGEKIWSHRYKDIRAFERHLARNGTAVVKFFLHISKDEQARRFIERIDDPDKNWKFSFGDLAERKRWDDYMAAYEEMIQNTARPEAPWYVVPANDKWYARLVISAVLVETLAAIDPRFPEVGDDVRRRLADARAALAAELPDGGTGGD
jgi:PPK2 family polyphosphate:nucleotide phosphotransferase